MKKPIQISIPAPCHENWNNMTPSDKGRFCASCQKNVRDFTQSSDREIAETLKKEGKLCGRFRASQLERELYIPKEKSKFWAAASAAAITLLTVGVNEVSAQTPVNTEQHETKTDNSNKNNSLAGLKPITGTVFDQQGLPLPGANIKVKGSIVPGVQTDFDGNFVIQASPRQKLEVTYVGMKTQVVTVGFSTTVPDVTMYDDPYMFMGEIIVGYGKLRISVASQYMFDY